MALIVTFLPLHKDNPLGTTLLLSLVTFSMAFIDTICDGILVVAQRIDPQHGSEDLQVLAWGFQAIGGVIPSGLSIILSIQFTLQAAYIIPAVIGLLMFVASLFVTKEMEQDNEKYMALNFKQRSAYMYRSMKQALKLDALQNLMIFFLVFLLIMPNFKDYLDYFYNFNVVWDASLEIVVSTGVLISTIVYAVFLEEVEIRKIAAVAIVFYLFNTCLNILLVNRIIRMNTWPFVSMQAILFEAPTQALFFLPAYVTVAKLIPDNIEASMYSILKSIQACSVLVYGRLLGSAIGSVISKSPTDTANSTFLTVLLCFSLVAGGTLACFLRLLPTQVEILSAQTSIFYEHFMKKKEADRTRIDLNRIATFA